MNDLLELMTNFIETVLNGNPVFTSYFERGTFFLPEGDILPVCAFSAATTGNIMESIRGSMRLWRGGIEDKLTAIANVVGILGEHKADWPLPEGMLESLTDSLKKLEPMISHCKSTGSSTVDREQRNRLLADTVKYCRNNVKFWALDQYTSDVIKLEDVHNLGFMLPGETGGKHSRKEPTGAIAHVQVVSLNEDFIRVVIDNATAENAYRTVSGWPAGVRNALIVIYSIEEKREIIRLMTGRLKNTIQMPEGSHGKQFIIKAAFLRHVDDTPRFGNEPMFSLPLTISDFAANKNK
jgi:hypothetical protein